MLGLLLFGLLVHKILFLVSGSVTEVKLTPAEVPKVSCRIKLSSLTK